MSEAAAKPQEPAQGRAATRLEPLMRVVRWTLYAALAGALGGASTTLFLKALEWATSLGAPYPTRHFLILPLALVASAVLTRWLAPEAGGNATDRAIAAVHQSMGRIPPAVAPVRFAATVITLASGGSAGKAGPCAQISAGLASGAARLLRLSGPDHRTLAVCGISAGFAAVLGAPIGGALLGVEILLLGQPFHEALFPSLVAGVAAWLVSSALGVAPLGHAIEAVPPLSASVLLQAAAIGVGCGVAAVLFVEAVRLAERGVRRLAWPAPATALAGSALLIAIGLLVSPRYLGLGADTLEQGLSGATLPPDAFLWKILAVSVTLACGGSGGVVSPMLFIGAAVGNLMAQVFPGGHVAAYSATGMAAMLAGAADTPIAASVLAIELFGPKLGPLAAIACIVSFLVSSRHSIYPSQALPVPENP